MKNLSIALLLLVFVGMQSLVAQEGGTLTVKVTPSVYGEGRIYLSGEKEKQKSESNPTTDGSAEGRAKFEADYKGIGGVNVELEGEIHTAESDKPLIGFGDNAYAYIHVLEAFGVDKKMFDAYLQSGRFEVSFHNAQNAGQDKWIAKVGALGRDKKTNMQLDLKVMDMLTIRYGVSFSPFATKTNDMDMGWALLFDKNFGDHKIQASLAYIANLNDNDQKVAAKVTKPSDFDQLGFSLAYTGTFGTIMLMPFFNLSLKGLIAKPDYFSYANSMIGWSAGIKFQLRDASKSYDLLGLGFDLGGSTRSNNDYTDKDGNTVKMKYTENASFKGVGLKVWTDGLMSVMGKNYLSIWTKVRLELDDPTEFKVEGTAVNPSRRSVLAYWGIGLEQYLINVDNASVKLIAELNMENIAPYNVKGIGNLNNSAKKVYENFKTYIDLGLDASFTSIFTAKVK